MRKLTSAVLADARSSASWAANEWIALESEFDGYDYVIAKLDVERPVADCCPRKIERQRQAVRGGADDAKIGYIGCRTDLELRRVQLAEINKRGDEVIVRGATSPP